MILISKIVNEQRVTLNTVSEKQSERKAELEAVTGFSGNCSLNRPRPPAAAPFNLRCCGALSSVDHAPLGAQGTSCPSSASSSKELCEGHGVVNAN